MIANFTLAREVCAAWTGGGEAARYFEHLLPRANPLDFAENQMQEWTMPLSDEQDQLEHDLRVKQMETNIKQMEANIAKIQRDARIEFVKIAISILAVVVAAFAAGHYTK